MGGGPCPRSGPGSSVVDLDGLLQVVVAGPLGRLVDVLDAQPGTGVHRRTCRANRACRHSRHGGAPRDVHYRLTMSRTLLPDKNKARAAPISNNDAEVEILREYKPSDASLRSLKHIIESEKQILTKTKTRKKNKKNMIPRSYF